MSMNYRQRHSDKFDKDTLYNLYCDSGLTSYEIAKQYGCSPHVVLYHIRKHGIELRRGGNIKGKPLPRRINIEKDLLVHLYVEKKYSSDRIAEICGCSDTTVLVKLKEFNIQLRHHNDTKRGKTNHLRKHIDYELATCLHHNSAWSLSDVGKFFGVSGSVVGRNIIEYGSNVKSPSEACQGKRYRELNPNWDPNITEEERQQRRDVSKHSKWRATVYERDRYTCQRCGDSAGGKLNAHHIESHGSNKGARWELENGITLCAVCHRQFHKMHGYGNNTIDQFSQFMSNSQGAINGND